MKILAVRKDDGPAQSDVHTDGVLGRKKKRKKKLPEAVVPVIKVAHDVSGESRDYHGRWTAGGGADAHPLKISSQSPLGQEARITRPIAGGDPWADRGDAPPLDATQTKSLINQNISDALWDQAWSTLDPGQMRAQHLDALGKTELGKWIAQYEPTDVAAQRDYLQLHVRNTIDSWAHSAADSNQISLALQIAITKNFGIADKYQKPMRDYAHSKADNESGEDPWMMGQQQYQQNKPFYDAFVKQVYNDTQKRLDDLGVKGEVLLYRGMAVDPEGPYKWAKPQVAEVVTGRNVGGDDGYFVKYDTTPRTRNAILNPVSSWASSETTAKNGGPVGVPPNQRAIVISAQVPRERIWSLASGTGPGCLNEKEVLVLAGPAKVSIDWRETGDQPWAGKENNLFFVPSKERALARGATAKQVENAKPLDTDSLIDQIHRVDPRLIADPTNMHSPTNPAHLPVILAKDLKVGDLIGDLSGPQYKVMGNALSNPTKAIFPVLDVKTWEPKIMKEGPNSSWLHHGYAAVPQPLVPNTGQTMLVGDKNASDPSFWTVKKSADDEEILLDEYPLCDWIKGSYDPPVPVHIPILKVGDLPGHDFHGNQWTGGMGGAAPITSSEARGNSRPVTPEEFSSLAEQGREFLNQFAAKSSPPAGLDSNWPRILDTAYTAAQQSWGGVTVDSHTGQPVDEKADAYAITVKQPGQDSVTIPENADKPMFDRAMNEARQRFGSQLANAQHNLGVFHDDDARRIDIDPVLIVKTPAEVEAIGAATHAVGGAYHFASGNGYFPPHVEEAAHHKVPVLKVASQYKSHAHFHASGRDPNRPFFETNPSKAEGVEEQPPAKNVAVLKVAGGDQYKTESRDYHGRFGEGSNPNPLKSQPVPTATPPPTHIASPSADAAPPALLGQDSLTTFPEAFTPLVAKKLISLNLAHSTDPATAVHEATALFLNNMEDAYNRGQESDEHWYEDANTWATSVGQKFNLNTQQVAAITSSLSPLRKWEDNKKAATDLLGILKANKPFEVTQELADDFNERRKKSGRTELVVAKPGTHLPQTTDATFLAALHPDMPVGAAGIRPVIQAIAISRGASVDKLMSGPKTRSFVNNITDPSDDRWTTIDTWMYRAALGDTKMPLTLDGVKGNYTLREFMTPRIDPDTGKTKTANTSFLGSPASKKLGVKPGIGLYPVFVDAVKEGARRHGISPNAYQARVWSTLVREEKS